MRTSRHQPERIDLDRIEAQPRDWQILPSFTDFKLQPTNYLNAIYDVPTNRLTKLTKAGLLGRKTFNGNRNNNQTQTYFRTPAGDEFLGVKGIHILPRTNKVDREQALMDIIKLSSFMGAREDGARLLFRSQLVLDPRFAHLKEPGRYHYTLPDRNVFPDDHPHAYVTARGEHVAIIDEMDCATESDKKIIAKFEGYRDLWSRRMWKEHGFDRALLRFTTTSKVRLRHLMADVAPTFGGKCPWILWAYLEDHTVRNGAPEVTTRFYSEPYQRIGFEPFSLSSFK
jgi:hypothetical protein